MTLVDKAKAFTPNKPGPKVARTSEHIDLAISWLKGEIDTAQVSHILERSYNGVLGWLSNTLRLAYQQDRIVETKEKE